MANVQKKNAAALQMQNRLAQKAVLAPLSRTELSYRGKLIIQIPCCNHSSKLRLRRAAVLAGLGRGVVN